MSKILHWNDGRMKATTRFVVRVLSASGIADTQREAIEQAIRMDPDAAIEVERVRDTDRGGRDKWRKP